MGVVISEQTLKRIWARRSVYMAHRLTVPITEPQYLWWDDVIAHQFEEALVVYRALLRKTGLRSKTRCYSTGLDTVLKIKFGGKNVTAHRFTYAVHCSLPLSQMQVARHQCGNFTCLNPAHIELGDQAQNFQDYLAAAAYGVRRDLLPRDPLETLR
jgi:hypothetical protein